MSNTNLNTENFSEQLNNSENNNAAHHLTSDLENTTTTVHTEVTVQIPRISIVPRNLSDDETEANSSNQFTTSRNRCLPESLSETNITSTSVTSVQNQHSDESQYPSTSRNANVRRSISLKNQFTQRRYGCASSSFACTIPHRVLPSRVSHGPPPLDGAPPSYSMVMESISTEQQSYLYNRPPVVLQPSPTFIAPTPPPSYAEVQGYPLNRSLMVTSVVPSFIVDQMVWGPEPITVVCPQCSHIIITQTETHRSRMSHLSALILCLCGCWPFCLLPYCIDSCKNTYHRCPTCNTFLGMYRPW